VLARRDGDQAADGLEDLVDLGLQPGLRHDDLAAGLELLAALLDLPQRVTRVEDAHRAGQRRHPQVARAPAAPAQPARAEAQHDRLDRVAPRRDVARDLGPQVERTGLHRQLGEIA
jgi:hypothetical protein